MSHAIMKVQSTMTSTSTSWCHANVMMSSASTPQRAMMTSHSTLALMSCKHHDVISFNAPACHDDFNFYFSFEMSCKQQASWCHQLQRIRIRFAMMGSMAGLMDWTHHCASSPSCPKSSPPHHAQRTLAVLFLASLLFPWGAAPSCCVAGTGQRFQGYTLAALCSGQTPQKLQKLQTLQGWPQNLAWGRPSSGASPSTLQQPPGRHSRQSHACKQQWQWVFCTNGTKVNNAWLITAVSQCLAKVKPWETRELRALRKTLTGSGGSCGKSPQ